VITIEANAHSNMIDKAMPHHEIRNLTFGAIAQCASR